MTLAPFRELALGRVDVASRKREDGSVVLTSRVPLGAYGPVLTDRLVEWSERRPKAPFLARRGADGRFGVVTYGEAWQRVERLAEGLLARGLSAKRPLAILAENGIEHALLALAALHAGVPYAPISPAYALLSTDFGKLRHVLALMKPGLVLVSDGPTFERAVLGTVSAEAEVAVTARPLVERRSTPFSGLESAPTPRVAAAHRAVTPDHLAKVLFTSGSTGLPKGVINTHRMLCSNLRQILTCFPCMGEEPLELVDWLPWNHTFGGNHNFGLVLETGGALYIDDGKPTPQGIAKTVENLREIAPTVYFNVPKGFVELLPHLRNDEALRRRFFSRLKLIFYAGAGLAQPVWDGLQELAVRTTGARVTITSGLGCTESSPSALFAHWSETRSGLLGVPVPGLELKLAPVGQKLEARYRGPNITPGYYEQPAATAEAFDEDGFYKTGDALVFVDPADPNQGMFFDGRIAEDFKLSTGTWVSFGTLRARLLDACAPLIGDAVLTGADRDYVAAILFPSVPACAELVGAPAATQAEVASHPEVRRRIDAALRALLRESTGSSNRVARAVLAASPPSLDDGEVTDKGSLNQRAVLERRKHLVDALYANPAGGGVIAVSQE